MKLSYIPLLLNAYYTAAFLIVPEVSVGTDPTLSQNKLLHVQDTHISGPGADRDHGSSETITWPVDQRWQVHTYTSPKQYALSASPNMAVDGAIHVAEIDGSAYSQLFYAQPYFVDGTAVFVLITMGDMYIGVSPDKKRITVDYYDEWEMEAVRNKDELEVYRFKPLDGEKKYWTVNPVDGGVVTLEEEGAEGCQEWVVKRV